MENSQYTSGYLSWFVASRNNPRNTNQLRSRRGIQNEAKRQFGSKGNVLVHPFSRFRWIWESLFNAVYLAYFLFVPFKICVVPRLIPIERVWVDYAIFVMDLVFLLDIVCSLNTGYLEPDTKAIVVNRKKVIRHYIATYFFFDLISSLPLDLFALMLFPTEIILFFVVQSFHFIKFYRYYTFMDNLQHFIVVLPCGKRMYQRQTYFACIREVVNFVMMIHFLVCIYSLNALINLESSWLIIDDINDLSERYQEGLIFVFCNICCYTYDFINTGNIYEVSLHMVGTLILYFYGLYFMVIVAQNMMKTHILEIKYNEITNEIQEYVKHKQVSTQMRESLLEFYHFYYGDKYFDEDSLLKILPKRIRAEILYHTYKPFLEHEMFNGVKKQVVDKVLPKVQYEIYMPREVIIDTYETSNDIYFILRGTVVTYDNCGKEICHRSDGEYFGETSALGNEKVQLTICAMEVTEVLKLKQIDFWEIFNTDKELMERFMRIIERTTTTVNWVQDF